MVSKLTLTAMILLAVTGVAVQQSTPEPVQTYGDAAVEKVLRLDPAVRIHCNLKDLPPVIGQDIPVCIKGLKPSQTPQDNLELLMFLNDMLLSESAGPKEIRLTNIERGDDFCLVSDIQVDGRDLCQLLVDKGLVNKVIEVPSSVPDTAGSSESQTKNTGTAAGQTDNSGPFVTTKSSKVYHRQSCPHAQRMDASKSVTFATRQEAEQSGRRPCKTCKP